ncbi:DMT family transporter [Pseudomonas sp. TH10]|uniref:DMT family transporter n=1 Tax=Pseudomonas sp. TH10 TaxID=2796376 RepID=UPI0019114EF5|nr:DMT family transporter [Pseudomonas sp. TH10]MBK5516734.1 DMT family transporter [Pseudomonas sp. TH10]
MSEVDSTGNLNKNNPQLNVSSAATAPQFSRPTVGIMLCLLSMLIFACQDGITKVLVRDLPVVQLVMVRYWVFFVFALGYAAYQRDFKKSLCSSHPWLQITRALIGVSEIALFGLGLRFLGLAEMHAIFAVFPLITLALAGAFLGEFIGVRRWVAAAIGFTGTLVILRPGAGVFDLAVLIPLLAALMFALFSVLTRKISLVDSFTTNMFYMASCGAIVLTCAGIPVWVAPTPIQWALIGVLASTGVAAQILLMQALKYATAATLQPFNYTLLVFASLIGLIVFGELPDIWTVVGAVLVIIGGVCAIKAKS